MRIFYLSKRIEEHLKTYHRKINVITLKIDNKIECLSIELYIYISILIDAVQLGTFNFFIHKMVGRPDSVEFPQVWTRFEKTLPDGSVKRFKIQDITEDMFEDVIEFMDENFLKDEPFTLAAGILFF